MADNIIQQLMNLVTRKQAQTAQPTTVGGLAQTAQRAQPMTGTPDQQISQALPGLRGTTDPAGQSRSRQMYEGGLRSYLRGDHKTAADLWQQAVNLDPANEDARKGLENYYAQGTPAPAPSPLLGQMEQRKQTLDKSGGKKMGGMFDVVYGRKKTMDDAMQNYDQ